MANYKAYLNVKTAKSRKLRKSSRRETFMFNKRANKALKQAKKDLTA